ncbi:hypothetical protein BR93DRAFT_390659 [Coniochaeta sp. PMI_546]|nr:hypothetical protein BR93DRAFT_390659 [Coniochaeta sp. PMI_546]
MRRRISVLLMCRVTLSVVMSSSPKQGQSRCKCVEGCGSARQMPPDFAPLNKFTHFPSGSNSIGTNRGWARLLVALYRGRQKKSSDDGIQLGRQIGLDVVAMSESPRVRVQWQSISPHHGALQPISIQIAGLAR